jgi:hypothetical protein
MEEQEKDDDKIEQGVEKKANEDHKLGIEKAKDNSWSHIEDK